MEKVCREQKFIDWIITSARNGDCIEEGFNMLMLKILEQDSTTNTDIVCSDNSSNNSFKLSKINMKKNSSKELSIDSDCC